MQKFLTNIGLFGNQLVQAAIDNQASESSTYASPVPGQIVYNTTSFVLKYWNGSTWVSLSQNGALTFTGTAPIVVSTTGNATTISINAATGTTAGSFSAADYTTFHAGGGPTSTNTNSAIVQRDGSGNFAATTITASSVTGLATPVNASDATNKGYVDAIQQGIFVKNACRAATTGSSLSATYANGTATASNGGYPSTLTASANGPLILDGLTMALGDRVLVKDQVSQFQNGIYTITTVGVAGTSPYVLTRAIDFNGGTEQNPSAGGSGTNIVEGDFTFVAEGSVNKGQGYVLVNTPAPITVGTTALTFTQFSGTGSFTAGNGITLTGNTVAITLDPASASANVLTLSASGLKITTANIAAVGTLTTGTWQATTIGTVYGGTGLTSYTTGDTIYASGSNTLSKLTGNATATKQFLSMTSSVPSWGTLVNTDIPAFSPATSGAGGSTGGVPAPGSYGGTNNFFLRSDGTWSNVTGANGGTVTSVALAAGATNGASSVFSISGSPVTNAGTLTFDFVATITQNKALLSPVASTGAPTFRALDTRDLPLTYTANGVVLTGALSSTGLTAAAGTAYQVLRIPSGGGQPVFGAIDLSQSGAVTGTLAIGNGGTGTTTAPLARSNSFLGAQSSAAVSPTVSSIIPLKIVYSLGAASAGTPTTVTHNLGTADINADLIETSTGLQVYADIAHTTNTTVVTFAPAVTAGQYRLVLIG